MAALVAIIKGAVAVIAVLLGASLQVSVKGVLHYNNLTSFLEAQ